MLQWMGGSRRKVNDSRGSKQKRQKQYFEQRKRQQHEQIISSRDKLVGGYNYTCSNNQKEKRSLDVLSLNSLSQVAEGCSSTCDGILKVDPLPEKYLNSRDLPKFIQKIFIPANTVETLQTRNISNTPEKKKRMPEEEVRIGSSNLYNSTSGEQNPKGKEVKHSSGHKFKDLTVFELIDEDGKSSNNSDEKTEYEAHVAFSIQGLGKVGNETPVKSPQSSKRISSDGQSGFFKAARHKNLHRNFDTLLTADEIDMESMIKNGDIFSNSKYSSSDYGKSWTFGSRDHLKHDFLKDNNTKLYDENPQVESFNVKENIDDIQEFHTNFPEVRTGFPNGSSYNEKFDMSRDNGCFTDVFNTTKTQEAEFTEDFSFGKSKSYSYQYGRTDRFCDLDFSCGYPKHHQNEDYDFLKTDDSNYFIANKIPNAGAKQSCYSFLKADNPMDNFSCLSGESCSSSAVRSDGIMGAHTTRKSHRRSSVFSGVPSENRGITEDFLEQPTISTKCMYEKQGERDRPRAYSRSCDLYPPRPVDFSEFALHESFGQVDDSTGKDGFHSRNVHVGQHTEFGSSSRMSDKDHPLNRKPVGEDIFGLLSASNFHFDSHLSFGGCKDDSSVESASPMVLPSKTFSFDQAFPDKGCGKKRTGSHQRVGTFVPSSESSEASGRRQNEVLFTEPCSAHRNAHDNSVNEKGSHEEEIRARRPEGSVTPKSFRETHDKLSNKNTDGILGTMFQENDNDTSSFVALSDNSSSRACEKECGNNNVDLQSLQLAPEISESQHNSVASDGEESFIEPSYQMMMLESHVVRLLCVKKKRNSAQKGEILKTVKVSM